MSIKSPQELAGMLAAGAVVRHMLEAMKQAVISGVTTADLDALGARVMREHGARSAPALVYKFPGVSCISVNDEAVHGIPGRRKLQEGDLVKLDVTIEKNGFMADAAVTVSVGVVSEQKQHLMSCVQRAFESALLVARAGNRVSEIGGVIEHEVRRWGFSVIRELGGHGIGRTTPMVRSIRCFALCSCEENWFFVGNHQRVFVVCGCRSVSRSHRPGRETGFWQTTAANTGGSSGGTWIGNFWRIVAREDLGGFIHLIETASLDGFRQLLA